MTPGDLNAIVSPGPWLRLEPGGRHDVNFRTRPNARQAVGYGAMQLAGPYACGPPPDLASAIGVVQAAVAAGVDHIDRAQYCRLFNLADRLGAPLLAECLGRGIAFLPFCPLGRPSG